MFRKIAVGIPKFFCCHAILRYVLFAVFLFSAISKQLVLDEFELYLYQIPLLSWNQTLIIARLIIGAEYAIGILYLLNIYTRKNTIFTFLVLCFFTLYLVFTLFFHKEDNCFCFGKILPMSTLDSILKNIALLAITGYLFLKTDKQSSSSNLIIAIILMISLAVPSTMWPPDFIYRKRHANNQVVTKTIPVSLFRDAVVSNDPNSVCYENKTLVCFFSMGCKHCTNAAHRIGLMQSKSKNNLNIIYVFFGKEDKLEQFWKKSKSAPQPYYVSKPSTFFQFSGKSLPAIYLLENSRVIEKYNYRSMSEEDILEFFIPN